MRLLGLTLLIVCVIAPAALAAPTVYSGFDVSFTKPAGSDWTLPVNQDLIVSNVVLTRGSSGGLYNVAQESSYVVNTSPVGTAWAFKSNNPGKTVAATNWADLSFTNWQTALGGGGSLYPNILDGSGVLHLVDDDIYLDIRFTDWGVSPGSGAGFAYERSALVPVPEPATLVALGLASIALLPLRRL